MHLHSNSIKKREVKVRLSRGLLGLLSILSLVLVSSYHAVAAVPAHADDSVRRREAVLGIVHLNFDCYADTVVGWMNQEFVYVPRFIRWGQPGPDDQLDSLGEGSDCLGRIPKQKKKRQTALAYPDWRRFSASVAFEHLNSDTLVDLVIHVRGEQEQENGTWRRVRMPLAIFGQHGLDTLTDLDLARAGKEKFQIEPFFAMELRKEIDLVEPGKRDLTGRTSWILNPPGIDMPEAPAPPEPLASVPMAGEGTVHIYPNPAAMSAQIEGWAIPPGNYTVEVTGLNGWFHLRTEATVGEAGNLFGSLDVRELSSGYYVVRLTRDNGVQGTYPIIITR